jgi:uncharacterized protein (TIGR03066 family)
MSQREVSMSTWKLLMAAVMVVALGAALRAGGQDTARLLVGTWEVTKADKDAPLAAGDTTEFTKDGKNKTIRKRDGKDMVSEGTYKFEKAKLVITFKSERGTSVNVLTIKKVTNTDLVVAQDEGGKVIEFKRRK